MDTTKLLGTITMAFTYLKWGCALLFHFSFFHHRCHNYDYYCFYQPPAAGEHYEYNNDVVSATAEDLQQSSECAVCLSEVERGDEIRKMACRHVFHKACLDRWSMQSSFVRRSPTCPLCRSSFAGTTAAPDTGGQGNSSGREVLLFDFAGFGSGDGGGRDVWWLR